MTWLTNGLILIGSLLFVLGTAMTLHEFGHYLVARLLKIRVEIFSFIGIGPRVWGFKRGNTDYRLSLIPLGAYVKLGGDESNASIEGEGASDIPRAERFDLRPRWQKIAVAVAGPTMNILTALSIPLIAALVFGIVKTPSAPYVASVQANSSAAVAGMQPGDRIVAFNGKENPTWDDITDTAILANASQTYPFTVERNGQRMTLQVAPKIVKVGLDQAGDFGITPDYGANVPVIVGGIEQGSAAMRGGFQPGDRIVSINNEPIRNRYQATYAIRGAQSETLPVTVERGGQQVNLTTPVERMSDGKGRLGINLTDVLPYQKLGLVEAGRYAVNYNWRILSMTGSALAQVFKGQRAARDTVSGPIGIGYVTYSAAKEGGFTALIGLLGLLSLSLGVFNLLPVPMLDGGMIFMLLIEGALAPLGVKLSEKMKERVQQVGLVALLLLMVFVISNDVLKLASNRNANNDAPSPPAANTQQK